MKADKLTDKALEELKELEEESKRHHQEMQAVCRKIKDMEDEINPRYIISDEYKKWHVVDKWPGVPRRHHLGP